MLGGQPKSRMTTLLSSSSACRQPGPQTYDGSNLDLTIDERVGA